MTITRDKVTNFVVCYDNEIVGALELIICDIVKPLTLLGQCNGLALLQVEITCDEIRNGGNLDYEITEDSITIKTGALRIQ